MTDLVWPSDLVPFSQSFYLQPYSGGSESPFSRQSKIYELAAPRWVCRMGFRGGYWGDTGVEALAPRLDALIASLQGRANRIAIHDFRRTRTRGGFVAPVSNLAASAGEAILTVSGFSPYQMAFRGGDYVGGDGRPHIVKADVLADSSGVAEAPIAPAWSADVGAGEAVYGDPPGWFRLTSDDAGMNPTVVGEAVTYDLEFVEDL